ncbi:MAG: hypothetical protein JW896_10450 [Deltaproteobacteria bacterium]|nr:hypothetical protein [Deltaproteobacteria bacterium]
MGIPKTPFVQIPQEASARFNRRALIRLLAFSCALFSVLHAASIRADEVSSAPVAVLYTLNRPFVEAVEGLSRVIKTAGGKTEAFALEDYPEKRRSILKEKMTQQPFGFYVGVGPQAARFIWDELDPVKARPIYSMVLNPEKVLSLTGNECGVSLNIPISTQVERISAGLPGAKRIGLLFDPLNNDPFFIQAGKIAEGSDLRIIPLRVTSSREIPTVLETRLKDIDALWLITDSTVTISESIIQFIIETALLNRVPVIGYNSFFYESGAALSFVFDYQELGEQTGELITELFDTGVCSSPDPKFSLWVNRKTIQRLDILLGEEAVMGDGAAP